MAVFSTRFRGSAVGSPVNDTFNLTAVGDFTDQGLGGNDRFYFGGALTAADKVDGGTGKDVAYLDGDYSGAHAVTLASDTLVGIERITLAAGHDYDLTSDDGTVASGDVLTVGGSKLQAGDSLAFNGAAETDGRFLFQGGAGDDTLTGGAGADTFDLTLGGADSANGGQGNDRFILGAAFTAADSIDGGLGQDSVSLAGNYSALVFGASTLVNVETLTLAKGFDYDLTTDDATVAAGATLKVDATGLLAGDTLKVDGSAETDGHFNLTGGAGNDTLIGGAQSDFFQLRRGGTDSAQGNGGNDTFSLGSDFTAADSIDGGAGSDTAVLNGDYSGGLVLGATTMTNVETLKLRSSSYKLTTDDATVAAGQTLTVDGSALLSADSLDFDGSAETDGRFVLTGGAGADTFKGGLQGDRFTGGAGADVFAYDSASESHGTLYDTITDFDATVDKFDLDVGVAGVNASSGHVDLANFDVDMGNVTGDLLLANRAVVVTVTSGTLNAHAFLVFDANNSGAYDSSDYVMDITGHTGTLTTGNFV